MTSLARLSGRASKWASLHVPLSWESDLGSEALMDLNELRSSLGLCVVFVKDAFILLNVAMFGARL